jgi:hypothetical protein
MNAARLVTVWVTGVMVVAVAACGTTTPSATPSTSASAIASGLPVASASAAASIPATAAPASPAPTTGPAASAGASEAAEACPISPQTGRLPSDRLVDVRLSSIASADLVTFVFGEMSLPEPPQGVSEGALQAAVPPYTEGASGRPIDVAGEHIAQIRFAGMSLSNDVGEPTYEGPNDLVPTMTVLKSVVLFDMSEGVIGWYLGYDGNGCLTLSSTRTSVTVAIDHPRS